ncbi:hypothetical protein [Novosphingopyxis iocasae]|nr:hypothetical protein [Novosphingopyxis iocasae]
MTIAAALSRPSGPFAAVFEKPSLDSVNCVKLSDTRMLMETR